MKKWMRIMAVVLLICGVLAGCAEPQGKAREIVMVKTGNIEWKSVSISCMEFQNQFNEKAGEDRKIDLMEKAGGEDRTFTYKRENGDTFYLTGDVDNTAMIWLSLVLSLEGTPDLEAWRNDARNTMTVLNPSLTSDQQEQLLKDLGLNREVSEWKDGEEKSAKQNDLTYKASMSAKYNSIELSITPNDQK